MIPPTETLWQRSDVLIFKWISTANAIHHVQGIIKIISELLDM